MPPSNTNGKDGEDILVRRMGWHPRPRGHELRVLARALMDAYQVEVVDFRTKPTTDRWMQASGFDALALPPGVKVNWSSYDEVRHWIGDVTFWEIKTAKQSRVKPGFGNFQGSVPFAEIRAERVLGSSRYRVMLFNIQTGETLAMSLGELQRRSSSFVPQMSFQVRADKSVDGSVEDTFQMDGLDEQEVDLPVGDVDIDRLSDWCSADGHAADVKIQRAYVERALPLEPISDVDLIRLRKRVDGILKAGRQLANPCTSTDEVWAREVKRLLLRVDR